MDRTMSSSDANSVPLSKKLSYAAPAFALAVVGIPVYVYIPKFYTDVVGVHITVLGYLILAVRLFDAVTDPAIGFLSDRTRTRFGRRRPYIGAASILLALAIYALFNPPVASPTFETFWFGVSIFSLFLFWTLAVVPYESLGPEITFDYHERTTLFGMRDGALIAGTLVAASSPALVTWAMGMPPGGEGEREKFFWISVLYGPLVVAFCWWCVLSIRERPQPEGDEKQGLWQGFRCVAQNRPFIILLVSYTVSAFGNNLPATLILYYVEYVLQSKLADLFLIIYFVTGVLFLPGWILVSRSLGKKWTWIASMGVNTGAFVGVFFLGPGDVWIYGILVFVSGIGLGATLAIPSAMQADVIDYDELLSGERREGHYIGLWSVTKKLAAALGVGIALPILGKVGYMPNVEQSEEVLLTLRLLYALVPSVCNIVALIIALAYPISRKRHGEIRFAIAERKAGRSVTDPLRRERIMVS
ncbi:MAG: glycoside-pentoside-hexuronide (GPH):cation symporter [Desulfobacteraceae bacterium]